MTIAIYIAILYIYYNEQTVSAMQTVYQCLCTGTGTGIDVLEVFVRFG